MTGLFLKHTKCFEPPINSKNPLGPKELNIRLDFIENNINVSKCKIDKIVQNKDDLENVLPLKNNMSNKSTTISTAKNENVHFDQSWFSPVKEGTAMMNHITVSDNKNCTIEYVSGQLKTGIRHS